MPQATSNGIQIEYDTIGESSSWPLLLIMGVGCQMICWDDEYCSQLAEKGFYVIRFDNRDTGLSTKFENAGKPDLMDAFNTILKGQKIEPAYTIEDMADDAIGLLDTLNIDQTHVCGISMGAAIAQTMAIRHPARVLSMTLIYGTTGSSKLPPPKPEALNFFISPPPETREEVIVHFVNGCRLLSGSGFDFDEQWHRDMGARIYDRCFYPQGAARQILAILAQGSRKLALAAVTVPTLVIHGTDDPISPVEGGKDIAATIKGSELMIIPGMGHDLPAGGAWNLIFEKIEEFIKRVENN
ncbi:MAG TPA: alpha/beta hydrolase [Deltaproteobacteria bacterium]|nr:alpha/beta hydrolase [Deltaproteobacteria bacterium]